MTDQTRTEEAEVDQPRSAGAPSSSEPALARLVALAADTLGAPAACLALRHEGRAVVVASHGVRVQRRELPWTSPLSEPAPLCLCDTDVAGPAARHPLFDGQPARFYVGAPVPGPDGQPVGALCAWGAVARGGAPPADLRRLSALADLAGDLLSAADARERAEAAAANRAGLLADVSHELRTPLGGIVGFAEALRRDGTAGDETLLAAERIADAGRGLLSIVSDALDLARFESGLVRLDPRAFSPGRLLEDAVAMVRPEAERKGLRLVVDLPDALPSALLADPDRLRQVILNLLTNAVKFTDVGTVRVALAAGRATGPGASIPLTLTVEDSGIGIAAGGIPRLFRRFAQADGTVARRYGGNGLGLAISKSLVEAMGGSIAVQSAPGRGTRFSVALKLPPGPAPAAAAPRDGRGAAPGALRGRAILVAEDAAMNQKLVREMLEPLGAAIDVVADGAAAVAAAARRDYALVLMDMEMPVLGGLDATRRIRALGGHVGSVPIVALTANAFPEQLDLCREAGMDDHLTKPFGADDLAAVAMRWARRLAAAKPAGATPAT